jgi:DNA-binding NarL/FixJ family response regulator
MNSTVSSGPENNSGSTGAEHPCLVMIQHRIPLFRESLGRLLQAQPGISVVIEVATSKALIERIAVDAADIAFVEVPITAIDRIELERLSEGPLRLVAVGPTSYRQHLSSSWLGPVRPTASFLHFARTAGLWAVATAPAGLPPEVTPGARGNLTDREMRILALLSNGYTTLQVASRMEVSPRSIKSAREKIRAKLEAQSTPQALAAGIRQGLLHPVGGS